MTAGRNISTLVSNTLSTSDTEALRKSLAAILQCRFLEEGQRISYN